MHSLRTTKGPGSWLVSQMRRFFASLRMTDGEFAFSSARGLSTAESKGRSTNYVTWPLYEGPFKAPWHEQSQFLLSRARPLFLPRP